MSRLRKLECLRLAQRRVFIAPANMQSRTKLYLRLITVRRARSRPHLDAHINAYARVTRDGPEHMPVAMQMNRSRSPLTVATRGSPREVERVRHMDLPWPWLPWLLSWTVGQTTSISRFFYAFKPLVIFRPFVFSTWPPTYSESHTATRVVSSRFPLPNWRRRIAGVPW